MFNSAQKKIECQREDFKKKAKKDKARVKFEIDKFTDFHWLIKNYRKNGTLLNRAQIMAAVESNFSESSVGFCLFI